MYHKLLLASAAAVALTGSAIAADLRAPPPPPPYIPPPPVFTWTGLYVGVQVGGAWGTGSNDFTGFDPFFTGGGVFLDTTLGGKPSGVIGGGHVGYQVQINQWIIGIEGSVDGSSLQKDFNVAFADGTFISGNVKNDIQGSIRGKLGIAWDRFMIYGTGGVAFAGVEGNLSISNPGFVGFNPITNQPFAVPGFFLNSGTRSTTRVGWTAGGGAQYALLPNWWVFAEYRYSDFGTFRSALSAAGVPVGFFFNNGDRRISENQVQAGFSYKFDLTPPAPVVAKY